jgi:hypothetical protein
MKFLTIIAKEPRNNTLKAFLFFASTFCKKLHRAFPKVAWGNSLLLHPL